MEFILAELEKVIESVEVGELSIEELLIELNKIKENIWDYLD